MANTTLRFKDMTFEKVENYDPENTAADKNGMVSYWVAKTPDGEQVVTGENKKKCISAARTYVHEVNEAAETVEASEVVEEQATEQQVTEQPEAIEEETQEVVSEEEKAEITEVGTSEVTAKESTEEPEINMWLMGYIPKKKQPAILMLRKDDDGYWCRIGNGYIVDAGKGEYDDVIHEAKWKEFLKSLRSVIKAA